MIVFSAVKRFLLRNTFKVETLEFAVEVAGLATQLSFTIKATHPFSNAKNVTDCGFLIEA